VVADHKGGRYQGRVKAVSDRRLPVMARPGPLRMSGLAPLSGVNRTCVKRVKIDAVDPKRPAQAVPANMPEQS
jgi:hypothetical protein